MKIVNPYFLDEFIRPLSGLGDDEEAVMHYQQIKLNTKEKYKCVINDILIAYFNNLDENKKKKAKLALSYYLTKPEIDFQRVFDSNLPPFDAPKDARDFYVWIWEELFPNESYLLSDPETYKVIPDINEPNRPLK